MNYPATLGLAQLMRGDRYAKKLKRRPQSGPPLLIRHKVSTCIILYILYNIDMKIISTTEARKRISDLLDAVVTNSASFVIGRHDAPEAVLVKFPTNYRSDVSDITNINAYSNSFDFLKDEPDIYSLDDIKK